MNLTTRNKCKLIKLTDDNFSSSSSNQKNSQKKINYTKDSFLYSWGKNKYGELGLGNLSNTCVPSPITSLDSKLIYSIRPGGRNTVIISTDGSVYFCGNNIFGLLAENTNFQNNEKNQKIFKKNKFFIENELNIKDIAIAEFHCLALDEKGRIFGWGGNLFNKLGRNNDLIQGIPNQINLKHKIISISCGDYHSCALSEKGILYSWGGGGDSYNKGQCGHGTTKDIQRPKKVEFFTNNNIKIKKVCCGGYHTIVIADSNELFSFGKGIYGQCGDGHHDNISIPKKVYFNENQNLEFENSKEIIIIDIKCGGDHSLFLSSNNNVYTCGHGYLGQLGLGNNKNINSPTIVKSLTNKKIIKIAAGWSHSLVLTSEGYIYSTGCNKYGELGIKKDLNKFKYTWIECLSQLNIKDISAGGHHSWCLIDSNKPLRDDNNEPEPLLKSNFSMNKKGRRQLSEISNNSSSNINQRNKNDMLNRSAISEGISNSKKNISSGGGDKTLFKKKNNSYQKIQKLFDDYNNSNENDLDNLIENINKIDDENNKNREDVEEDEDEDKFSFNSEENEHINDANAIKNLVPNKNKYYDDSFNDKENNKFINNNNYNDKYKNNINNKIEEDELINNNKNKNNIIKNNNNDYCELKIVYTDLNLSHRFIRFQSSIDYNKLNYILKKRFLNKDKSNISFQFQRDDEIEKNNMITPEINYILNNMKKEKLINLDKLSYSYTLGIVYDYSRNNEIKKYLQKNKIDIDINNEITQPLFGFKNINSNEINSSEKEKILSNWIIDFTKIYNELYNKKEEIIMKEKPTFFELRPNIFK